MFMASSFLFGLSTAYIYTYTLPMRLGTIPINIYRQGSCRNSTIQYNTLIVATSSQTFHSYFPLFDVDHLKLANCSNLTIVFYPLGNFGQALLIRSCHEDVILTRKNHNCSGIGFIQGDSAGGSKMIEQTIVSLVHYRTLA